MAFEPHGSFDLEILGEVVLVTLEGSWNLEQGKKFFEAYKPLLLEQGFTKFGVVSDFRNLDGATPEAIAFFEEVTAWAKDQGQMARAQVLNSALREYIVNQATKSPDIFHIQSFDNEEEALDWMAGLGLRIS